MSYQSPERRNDPAVNGDAGQSPRQGKRLLFALLSAMIPGTGQMLAGYRWRGAIMIAVTGIVAAVGLYYYQQGTSTILSYLVQPRILVLLFIANAIFLLFRLGAVIDAYWKSGAEERLRLNGWRNGLVVTVLAVLLIVTAAPHAVLGYYTYLSHDLLTDVFDTESLAEQLATPTPEPGATPEPTATPVPTQTPEPTPTPRATATPGPDETPAPSPTPDPSPTPEPTPTPEPEPTATPEPAFSGAEWEERGRLTVLLVGSDAGPDRPGARADAIMVASLDLETGQPALFGIPRNFGDVPLPESIAREMGVDQYPEMISSLYAEAQEHPRIAPEGRDPGLVALRGAAEELLGIPIDYYAMVDMAGFVDMVNAFGGATVNVRERIHVRLSPPEEGGEWRTHDIQPGVQELDGHEALAYVRSREGASDYDRMQRQRCLVASMAEQANVQTLLRIFPDLVKVIRDNLYTDIPLDQLPDMVMLRDKLRTDQTLSIGLIPPEFAAAQESSEGYTLPDYDHIQQTVQDALENPEQYLDESDSDLIGEPC